MTTINTSSLNLYSSPFALVSKTDQDKANEGATTAGVNLRASVSKPTEATNDSSTGSSGGSPAEQAIEQLKERIKETQKRLQEQTRQLAAAQRSKAPDELKNQQVMAIQQQISGTTSELAAEQASLMQLLQTQAKGSVNTTA